MSKARKMSDEAWFSTVTKLPPEAAGALMAMGIATLRVIYDKDETRPLRILLEALICGALSLTVSSGIIAMGLSASWAIAAGGTIGYLGSATVRAVALKVIETKASK